MVGHCWENLLHNQSALWLKGRLLFTPGVMVTSVPWQLMSSARAGRPCPWVRPPRRASVAGSTAGESLGIPAAPVTGASGWPVRHKV